MLHGVLAHTVYVFLSVNQVLLYHILLMLRHILASISGLGVGAKKNWILLNSATSCAFGSSINNPSCDCDHDTSSL